MLTIVHPTTSTDREKQWAQLLLGVNILSRPVHAPLIHPLIPSSVRQPIAQKMAQIRTIS